MPRLRRRRAGAARSIVASAGTVAATAIATAAIATVTVAAVTTAAAAARGVGEELVDQILQHQRRLREGNLAPLMQKGVGSTGRDADVVRAEQSGGLDGGVAVVRYTAESML